MFWLRQLTLIILVYVLISIGLNDFFWFQLSEIQFINQLIIITGLAIFSGFIYGRTTLKSLYSISFIDFTKSAIEKDFVISCAKDFYAKGALSLESKLKLTKDPFIHKAIHLIVEQVSISQMEKELQFEFDQLNYKLQKTKTVLMFIILNFTIINVICLFGLNSQQEVQFSTIFIPYLVFPLFLIIGLFLPLYFLIDQYQVKKNMIYKIYKLGFVSIVNKMSSRQIEIAISTDLDI